MFVWADDHNTNITNRRERLTVVFICPYLILFVCALVTWPYDEQLAASNYSKRYCPKLITQPCQAEEAPDSLIFLVTF